ncbi:MAG: DUF3883 domain-containing protein [Clostridia bacterium]|nr:DUF3883 domain-containing protein [Clostridia bacterium]
MKKSIIAIIIILFAAIVCFTACDKVDFSNVVVDITVMDIADTYFPGDEFIYGNVTFTYTFADGRQATINASESMIDDIEAFLGISLPNSQLKTVVKTITDKGEKIGKWGENFVFIKIKSKYIQEGYKITQMNDNQFSAFNDQKEITVTKQNFSDMVQKGYDITIESDEFIEYIEVKTREGSNRKSFNISGTQWQFAKSLELNGKGDNYSIYF